jgi:hypothetical protein
MYFHNGTTSNEREEKMKMKNTQIMLTALIAFFVACVIVNADVVLTDLYGDKDGFGIGVPDGDTFDWMAVGPSDGDGTDQWRTGNYSWLHTYNISSLDGPIVEASLELFHGGDGQFAPSEVFVNGISVGLLTVADGIALGANYAFLDIIDLTPAITSLGGSDNISVSVSAGGDGWVLDYSELTIKSIPEPASLGLLALVSGGIFFTRRFFIA